MVHALGTPKVRNVLVCEDIGELVEFRRKFPELVRFFR